MVLETCLLLANGRFQVLFTFLLCVALRRGEDVGGGAVRAGLGDAEEGEGDAGRGEAVGHGIRVGRRPDDQKLQRQKRRQQQEGLVDW